ncbi:MAG: GNAT family N-acetyltransferase [Chloroflexi bacterium]|nr:GNAT family N-acetyltransferase [Chloroflexota bacterium]
MADLFSGKLVRLSAPQPDDYEAFARWSHNPEYLRLMDADPAKPHSARSFEEWERSITGPNTYLFRIRLQEDNTLIGFVALDVNWPNQNAFLAIGIGEPAVWGKGYGSEAMTLILDYAFNELSLHRVGLNVIATNTRAIVLYEKMGFVYEGAQREWGIRDGQ